jgi:hypothetical protein
VIETVIIYIPLLNEGVDVVRPTRAIKHENNCFEVLPTENYDPSDEQWAFLPKSIVECEIERWENDEILVAKRIAQSKNF